MTFSICTLLFFAGRSVILPVRASELQLNDMFHRATTNNELDVVNYLLSMEEIDVNYVNQDGKAALHIAAERGFGDVFKALLFNSEGKIKLNVKDERGWTAYHYAAVGGHAEIIEILAFTELFCNSYDTERHMTPMQMAIEGGKEEAVFVLLDIVGFSLKENCIVEMDLAVRHGRKSALLALIEDGCNLDEKDANGNTVLFHAIDAKCAGDVSVAYARSADIVSALLLKGANLAVVNNRGQNAASVASQLKNFAALSVIRTEMSDGQVLPALHLECRKRNPDLKSIRKYLNFGNVNERDHLQRTCAHAAVVSDNVDVLVELIIAGCDLTLKDAVGNTVLHYVESPIVAKILVKIEPKLPNIANEVGDIPLHAVISNGRENLVAILALATTDIGARNKRRYTALGIAAENGALAIAECLLKLGAGERSKFKMYNPLHNSAYAGDTKMAKLLVSNGFERTFRGPGDTLPAHFASASDNLDMIKFLMEGVDPSNTDMYGSTLLHYAATSNDRKGTVIKMLVEELRVPLESKTFDGKTALHLAAMKGIPENMETLIECGANVTATSSCGKTALHYAILHFRGDSHLEIISDLIHADRNLLNIPCSDGFIPLNYIGSYYANNNMRKIAAMELAPCNVPAGELEFYMYSMSPSFVEFQYKRMKHQFVPFQEYLKRGMMEFKWDNNLIGNLTLREALDNGIGIFYAFAAAYYPTWVWTECEYPQTETEMYAKKQEEYRNAVEAFEIYKSKIAYMKELRYMLVECFLNENGRKRLYGTYMHFLPYELIDDALVGITNNNEVWERMELVANALMLTFNYKYEMMKLEPATYLWSKMARLSEAVIPK